MTPYSLLIRGDATFKHTRTFDAALKQLGEATCTLGFDTVDYGFMPHARSTDGRYHAPTIVARNMPRQWLRGWGPFLREDPLLYGSYPRTLPLDWQEIQQAAWLTPIQRQAFQFIDELGIRDGVTVPIHLPDNAFAFVTVACRERYGTWRSQKSKVLERLFVLAHAFHADHGGRAKVVHSWLHDARITPRERVVLSYAAAGLSAPETALRIHRSVETVRLQRKSAMRKLNAHTMAQAVAHAIDGGIIALNPTG